MLAQVFAVIIFIAMFVFIVTEIVERHVVSLVCALLTIIFVFGVGMHSMTAVIDTINLKSIFTTGFWYMAGESGESSAGINWETIGACGKEVQQSGKLDTLLGLLCSNHITLFTGNAFGCPEAVRALAGALDRPVVDYMHRADGKKRN